MKESFDAIVVGAGPAGCAAAYSLAKAGLEVLLVERGKSAGVKNITGGVLYGPVLNNLIPGFLEGGAAGEAGHPPCDHAALGEDLALR